VRIVIVSRGAFPGYDGPARRVKYLGSGLAKNGCDVTLVVAYPPSSLLCDQHFEDAYGYRYIHTIRGEHTESTGLLKKLYHKLYGTAQVCTAIAELQAVRRVDAILICGVGFVELIVTLCIARRFKIKIGVDKNDTNYRLKARSGMSLYGFLSGINIALSELLLNRCVDTIFTVNTYLHDHYTKTARGKVKYIIPSFIDCREIETRVAVDGIFDHYDGLKLLSVITTPPHSYGFVPFAQALSALKTRYRFKVFLLSAPDRETVTCVNQLLARHDLNAITKILTRVPPDLIQSVYSHADIILNAQQEPEIAEGGFPGKTAEILASGKPIVTTLFSDLDRYYIHGSNCLVVSYGDVDSYVNAITALCESSDLRERLGRAGRRTAFQAFEFIRGTKALKEDLTEMVDA
jgi:glycosyltransferase involved in cell wall biosynthesis